MRATFFAARNQKELLRDPLTLVFSLGFPIVLLLLLSAIQASIPVPLFEIASLTPGILVFGLSFIALFSATLIARDRSTAFLTRLFTSPLSAADFIWGYTAPLFPLALGQMAVCLVTAVCLRLPVTGRLPALILAELPAALLFVGLGLLCGSLFNDRQVGGLCGALLTNLTAWLSGAWFDLELVGGTFYKIAHLFPFAHAVEAGRAALAGQWGNILPHAAVVLGWAAAVFAAAVFAFRRKMREA